MTNYDECEELTQKAIEVIRLEGKASVAMLQRRLRLGYPRACRIMDELERRKIVGPAKGNGEPRDVLIETVWEEAVAPREGRVEVERPYSENLFWLIIGFFGGFGCCIALMGIVMR